MNSKPPLHHLALFVVFAAALVSCGSGGDARVFEVRGVIQELPEDQPLRVVIDHEEMPGYMGAMIMPFRVKDAAELEGLQPGDQVTFEYHVTGTQSWVEKITPTGKRGEVQSSTDLDDSAEEPLEVGAVLPDFEFVDESGQDVKLSDFRGKTVALTFVFSRCPVPEYCPAMMHKFRAALDSLKEHSELNGHYQLLTVSFDTENDTPETMKTWGAAFGFESGQPWKLLTSDSCCTINEIAAKVGLKFGEHNGSYQHNLRTVVLDSEGRISRIFKDETWKTSELVEEILTLNGGYLSAR